MQVTDEMVRVACDAFEMAPRGSMDCAMCAALTAALAAMWRPITDEVKDGRPGILFSPYAEDLNCKGGLTWISGGYGKGAIHPGWRGESNKEAPTHFMPLPLPPAQKEVE